MSFRAQFCTALISASLATYAVGENHEIYRNRSTFQTGVSELTPLMFQGGINAFRDAFGDVDSIVAENADLSFNVPLSQSASNPRLFEFLTPNVPSIEDLETLLPYGNYDLLLTDTDSNEFNAVLTDAEPRFTNVPLFLNYSNLASYDPTQPFTVEWDAMIGGNSLSLQIFGPNGFYYVDRPGIGATSTVIPAGTLAADQRYVLSLVFADVAFIQDNGFDGSSFGQVFYQHFTQAEFATVPTPASAGLLAFASLAAARRRR